MQLVTEQVKQLNEFVEYDINVVTDEERLTVSLTFYPLLYPGDAGYPVNKSPYEHGFPIANYSKFYSLVIPKNPRGPLHREALRYLEDLVTEGSYGDVWDLDGMDWTSVDTVLVDAPQLIKEFVATLPRRGTAKESK